MLLKLIAFFILSNALAVFGRDETRAVTHAWDLGQEPVTGRCLGVTDGDTIRVLTLTKNKFMSVSPLSMHRRKARLSTSEPNRP